MQIQGFIELTCPARLTATRNERTLATHVEMACRDWPPVYQKALEPRRHCAVYSFRGGLGTYGSGVRERVSAPLPYGR